MSRQHFRPVGPAEAPAAASLVDGSGDAGDGESGRGNHLGAGITEHHAQAGFTAGIGRITAAPGRVWIGRIALE